MKPGHDYRVLQPKLVMDPNRNRSAVAFDTLGMVAGTAVMGKPEENRGDSLSGFDADLTDAVIAVHLQNPLANPHDILQHATTRLVYDLFAYQHTQGDPQPQPAVVYALARETHDADLKAGQETKIQHNFSYSDGFGREIQKKIQAEPGPLVEGGPEVSPRWVGSGWTIFNNKGKPVRQYEPFFSPTNHFEFAKIVGVSPVLFYDPVERVITTLHPNHTYEKVVFNPWQQTTYDVNDTVAANDTETGDPRSDKDIKGYVVEYFKTQPNTWQTWHQERITGAKGVQEKSAAEKAAKHANTPTTACFDTLGRPFLTLAHNGFKPDGKTVQFPTRVLLDIEGNQRVVRDAIVQNSDPLGRIVMRHDYDMLGNKIHQASMEAGARWMLNDVGGKPIRAWDSRAHTFRTEYDALRRPVTVFVLGSDPQNPAKEILFGKTEYGEGWPKDIELNLRTRVFRQYDGAGIVTNMARNPVTDQDEAYDFKGNLLRSARQLAQNYKASPDWSANPVLEPEIFSSSTTYDALNRPVTSTAPDNSVVHPSYNEANLLEQIKVNLRGAANATTFVSNIDYNAKSQRERIDYGNGVTTQYAYDPKTFHLVKLRTTRQEGQAVLQDLSYAYDPAGNIISIRDDAQQMIYFKNQVVEPHADYTYDAIYRLIEATGREHIGQLSQPQTTWDDQFRVNLPHPSDGQAMRRYTEQYEYDEVGNFLHLIHQAVNGNWTRNYSYNQPSLIEPGKISNRLSKTTVGATTETYTHDAHGNMTAMPHLLSMGWGFKDEMHTTDLGGGGTAFYVYDAGGQRVRKVWEHSGLIEERIYLGGYEIYRKRKPNGVSLERQTLHVMDGKGRIALVETKTVDTASPPATPVSRLRYQLGNHLSSAALELDDTGLVISYEEYHPYGTTSFQATVSGVEVSLKRYRYTGKERDEETGLYYHGARYFTPWLGRWTSTDPAGVSAGLNSYEYVRNNPLMAVDATGAWPEWLDKRVAQAKANVSATVETVKETVGARIEKAKEAVSAGVEKLKETVGAEVEKVKERVSAAIPDSVKGRLDEGAAKVKETAATVKETATKVYHSKPAQFAIGFAEAHAGAGLGAVVDAHKQAVGMVFIPYGAYQNYEKFKKLQESLVKAGREGGKAGVFVEVNRQFNPVFQALEGADEAYQAGKAGNWREAGRRSHKSAVGVVGTVGMVVGAAGGLKGRPSHKVVDPVIEVTEVTGPQRNRVAGNAFRDELAEGLVNEGRGVRTEVYKWTPLGRRFIDIEVSQGGRVLGGIEAKVGSSPYTLLQRAKDAWLGILGYKVHVARPISPYWGPYGEF